MSLLRTPFVATKGISSYVAAIDVTSNTSSLMIKSSDICRCKCYVVDFARKFVVGRFLDLSQRFYNKQVDGVDCFNSLNLMVFNFSILFLRKNN